MNEQTLPPHQLDQCRLQDGNEGLRKKWGDWYSKSPQEALGSLREPNLTFPSLYVIKDKLNSLDLIKDLIPTHQIALIQSLKTLHGAKKIKHLMSYMNDHQVTIAAFRWIVVTGGKTLIDSDYANVVDNSCLHLLHYDTKQTDLRALIDLVFYRHRQASYRHYVLSYLYDHLDPDLLLYIGRYLFSEETLDVTLAIKLLAFIPEMDQYTEPSEQLQSLEAWVEGHSGFLFRTGETPDSCPRPLPLAVHYGAKYLGKTVRLETGEWSLPLTNHEQEKYLAFTTLSIDKQITLAEKSHTRRHLNRSTWRKWMEEPLSTQLNGISSHGRNPL